VGKSSLLRALTNARPKVGAYAFTTLHPHVGIVDYQDFLQVSIADFPGILPDLTSGFGTKFFHHLDECRILVFVVDLSRPDAFTQFEDTRKALEFYKPSLLQSKSALIIGNKVDLVADLDEKLAEFKSKTHIPVIPMSVEKKINLRKFLVILRDAYTSFIDENKKI
jgi:GTP-binding protein